MKRLCLALSTVLIVNAATLLAQDTPCNVSFQRQDWYEAGTAPDIKATIQNPAGLSKSLSIKAVLQSNPQDGAAQGNSIPALGVQIGELNSKVTVPAGGKETVNLAFGKPLPTGYYNVSLLLDDGKKPQLSSTSVLVLPGPIAAIKENRFGMNVSQTAMIPMLRRLGISWVRFENMKWAFFNPAPRSFAYDGSVAPWKVPMDSIIKEYTTAGFKVLPYIFQTPQWASSAPEALNPKPRRLAYPPKDNKDYGEAIFQTVARYGHATQPSSKLYTADKKSGFGQIGIYELWNEANLNSPAWGFWVGDMPSYFELFRVGAEAAKRADPKALVSFGGFAGLPLDVVKQVATYKYSDGKRPIDFSDIINVHFYSGKQNPETAKIDPNAQRNPDVKSNGPTYEDNLAALVAWRDKTKPKAEIWITETGNDVGGPIGLDERQQAAKIPRCVMMSIAAGVEKSFLYREVGSDIGMHAGAGLIRNDKTVRPSFLTFATMVREFADVPYQRAPKMTHSDHDVWMYSWKRSNGRRLVVAWSLRDGGTKLDQEFGECTVTDAFGCEQKLASTKALQLGIFPVYIDCK